MTDEQANNSMTEDRAASGTAANEGFAGLLPCPFCGSKNLELEPLIDDEDWSVSCKDCEIQQIANYTKDEAIRRWNRRPRNVEKYAVCRTGGLPMTPDQPEIECSGCPRRWGIDGWKSECSSCESIHSNQHESSEKVPARCTPAIPCGCCIECNARVDGSPEKVPNEETLKLEIVSGVEGPSVYLNDTRIAGPKPWGGGKVIHSFMVRKGKLDAVLAELDKRRAG